MKRRNTIGLTALLLLALGALVFFMPWVFYGSEPGWFLGFSSEHQMSNCLAVRQTRFVARTVPNKDESWKLVDFDNDEYFSNLPWPFYKRFKWRVLSHSDSFWINRKPAYPLGEATIDERGVLIARKHGLIAVEVSEGGNKSQRVLYLLPLFDSLVVTPNPIPAARHKLVEFTVHAVSEDGVRAPAEPAPVVYTSESLEVHDQPSAYPRMFSPWKGQFFSVTTKEKQYLEIRYFGKKYRVDVIPDKNAPGIPAPWPYPGGREKLQGSPPDSASAKPIEIERATLMKNGCSVME